MIELELELYGKTEFIALRLSLFVIILDVQVREMNKAAFVQGSKHKESNIVQTVKPGHGLVSIIPANTQQRLLLK